MAADTRLIHSIKSMLVCIFDSTRKSLIKVNPLNIVVAYLLIFLFVLGYLLKMKF